MNKKLQVFVSSTYTDLIEERQAAVQAILDAGHIPAGMELFKAGKSQMKTIRKWIDESDVYMLILGGRYGSIEEESGLSYTELEYRYALSKNMPVFAIVLDDSFLFTKAASKGKGTIFETNNIDKYTKFLEFVKTNIVKFITNIDQISSNIHSHLNNIIFDPEYNLIGWTRNVSNNDFVKLLEENDSLKKQVQNLKDSLDTSFGIKFMNYPPKFMELILKSYDFDYYDQSQINAYDFLMSNLKKLEKGYLSISNNIEYPILSFLEECHIVNKREHISTNRFDTNPLIFTLSFYGSEFCIYINEYKQRMS